MRIGVLPRQIAERIITGSVARAAWSVNAINLVVTIPLLVEFLGATGHSGALPAPLGILMLLIVLAVGAAIRPTALSVVAFLVLGSIGTVCFEIVLITADPTIIANGLFLLNRPAVSLVLIGVATTSWLSGIVWTAVGLLVSTAVSATVGAVTSTPLTTGLGPLYLSSTYVGSYLVLAAIQRRRRRSVPNFDELEEETRRLDARENLRARITSSLHDTLLNDLSIVMNAPDELDVRITDRLRADLATLRNPAWIAEAQQVALVDAQDSELRNQIMLLVSEFQWRGLTVHVTGAGDGIYRLAPEVAAALVDALRACLENVLKHSGAAVAEVDLAYTETEITVITSDEGAGFAADQVAPDRLGVRLSIIERVSAVGGSAKIWSSPGSGTAVIIRVPVLERLTAHEVSPHQETPYADQ